MSAPACARCGFENPPAEVVCSKCGTEIDDATARALIGESVLSVYEITDVLGRGGMSVVYRGRHKLTEQRVALKILPPELAIHAALKTRFVDEAKALARLEHANIVRLYNFGEEAGRFVLAMELVEGQTFERMILERGKVAWREVTKIGVEVLRALEYAHDKGVVHRDIKPSNVLVRADGSATVMDFGIAKMTESSRLTATGQTMGTVRYMSPEQVRGQVVDLRTDLYSLGVALHEGLAGDTPFQGDTHFDIMSKHLNEPAPPVRKEAPDAPEALERVLLKSLGKAREARYQTAAEFREALEKCLEGAPADAVAAPPAAETRSMATPAAAPVTRDDTGLASRLEPVYDEPLAAPSRMRLWLALAGLVAAGGVVAAVLVLRGGGAAAVAGPGAAVDAAPRPPDAREAVAEWPAPPAFDDVRYAVDERFAGTDQVRIQATRALDPGQLRDGVVKARKRFVDFVDKRGLGLTVELHAFNLVVIPPALMCDPRVYAPEPVWESCARIGCYYEPQSRTLFCPDDDNLVSLNLPEGVAAHLCRTTPAMHKRGCGPLVLDAYFDAVEAAP